MYDPMLVYRHLDAALLTSLVASAALSLLKLYAARHSFRKLQKVGIVRFFPLFPRIQFYPFGYHTHQNLTRGNTLLMNRCSQSPRSTVSSSATYFS